MDMAKLLKAMVKFNASDLHLQVASPPRLRVDGHVMPLESAALTAADLVQLFEDIADRRDREQLQNERSADFSRQADGLARFRVNAYYQSGTIAMTLRQIPLDIPALDSLNLPKSVQDIALAERGLVLVTGTTGSGKSTTLAGIIDRLNQTRPVRIITIEDPVEFVYTSTKGLVAQRQVGHDSLDFGKALRGALRQDPDIILVGELRDVETMRTALQAADTGHMVFSTMHTANASQTIQRLIAMFPAEEAAVLLMQLAANLEAVICQRLARRRGGGRMPVCEILRTCPPVRKAIAENNTGTITSVIGSRDQGMQLFDQHLADLYNANQITGTEALRLATNPEAVGLAMRGISSPGA